MRPLSNIEEVIQKSIYDQLYFILLREGYIPDRKEFGSDPVNDKYKARAADIATAKRFAVALYGHGSSHDRDKLSVPRIVITGLGFLPGSVGRDFGENFTYKENGKYLKTVQATPSSHYRIKIELISNATSQDRLIEAVRMAALPSLSFIPHFSKPEESLLIEYAFTSSRPNTEYGLINKEYTYEVKDVYETEAVELPPPVSSPDGISPILEIDVIDPED